MQGLRAPLGGGHAVTSLHLFQHLPVHHAYGDEATDSTWLRCTRYISWTVFVFVESQIIHINGPNLRNILLLPHKANNSSNRDHVVLSDRSRWTETLKHPVHTINKSQTNNMWQSDCSTTQKTRGGEIPPKCGTIPLIVFDNHFLILSVNEWTESFRHGRFPRGAMPVWQMVINKSGVQSPARTQTDGLI